MPVLSALHVSPNGNDGYDQEHEHNHYDGMTAGIAVNSNYKERHTQYSQLANRLKMTKTSLSLGSVLEVPGAWGLFGDVWRCVL